MRYIVFVIALLAAAGAQTRKSSIVIVDPDGRHLPNVSVITQTIDEVDHSKRVFLTDASGRSPILDFPREIYRLIATCPYGPCETTVYDFLSTELGPELRLTVGTRASPENLPADNTSSSGASPTRTVTIATVDVTGAAFSDVLLIVRSLPDGREVGRYLTGADGRSPALRLPDGPLQIIATCPYGLCTTKTLEIHSLERTQLAVLELELKPSDSEGEIYGASRLDVRLNVDGAKSNDNILILTTDTKSRWFRSYARQPGQTVSMELIDDPLLVTVFVDGRTFRRAISSNCDSLASKLHNGVQCINQHNYAGLTLNLH